MMKPSVAGFLALLACLWATGASASILRGSSSSVSSSIEDTQLTDDFQCSRSSFFQDSCLNDAVDDDGKPCVWCVVANAGICVSEFQSSNMELLIPEIECQSGPSDAAATDVESTDVTPLDPTCLAAGMGSDDAQSVCDGTIGADGQPCVWCDAAGVFGLCLSSEQSESAGQYLQCDGVVVVDKEDLEDEQDEKVNSPMDPACFSAAWQSDDAESACREAKDQEGESCVWCVGPMGDSSGVCLNEEQADLAGQYLTCETRGEAHDDDEEEEEVEVSSPLDPSCVMAAFQDPDNGESICHTTEDQDGQPCIWCLAPNAGDNSIGVCLSADQAAIAGQFFTCDGSTFELLEEEEVEDETEVGVASPLDPSCAMAAFQDPDNGESICHTTEDQDGQPCIWCLAPNAGDNSIGVCLSADQAAIAGQFFTCDGSTFELLEEEEVEDETEDGVASPLDPSCAMAAFQDPDNGESICHTTEDQDGQPCVWCPGPDAGDDSIGVCLSADQAAIAGQFLTCEDTGFEGNQDEEQEQEAVSSPLDTRCVIAAFQNPAEGESICRMTEDQDGQPCVWCLAPNAGDGDGLGLCLSADQAAIAGQYFSCEDQPMEEVEENEEIVAEVA